MIIRHLDGDTRYGVTDYIDMITTRKVTRLTINQFIKSRIETGDLIEVQSAKKAEKRWFPRQKLYLIWIHILNISARY